MQVEIPFKPARVLLQDIAGVPAVVDLAGIRSALQRLDSDSNEINPLVQVQIVIDSAVHDGIAKSSSAFQSNLKLEFQRDKERLAFLKWGCTAFSNMHIIPPGSGTVNQVNLESLGQVAIKLDGILYPDTVVGTDSHITMIGGIGVAGFRVGEIEAKAAMLGQAMRMVLPAVVGLKFSGRLKNDVTTTDLVLTVTQKLRDHGVAGKFVEFYGDGMQKLSWADRAAITSMAPEYGAMMGFCPVDDVTLDYLLLTGKQYFTVRAAEAYLRANNMFVDYTKPQEITYSSYLQLDLSEVERCISGPKGPQDWVLLKDMRADWHSCLVNKDKGFSVPSESKEKVAVFSYDGKPAELKHGSVVIAAISSCMSTSNPREMVGAGLVAKRACELGLQVKPWIKRSLTPGSGVVTKYLLQSGLQEYLNKQGFNLAGYGCTMCIGGCGDLDETVASAISENGTTHVKACMLHNQTNPTTLSE